MSEFTKGLNATNARTVIGGNLIEMRNEYREEGVPTILTEGLHKLLLTASISGAKNILELGTATGCSATVLLKNLKDAKITTVDIDEDNMKIAKENFRKYGVEDRITAILGDALEVVKKLDGEGEKFDFCFLDCNKSKYVSILPYVKNMLKEGGVLFADNVLFRGYVSGEVFCPHKHHTIMNRMREFLQAITEDEDFITEVTDVGDGVSVSYKRK